MDVGTPLVAYLEPPKAVEPAQGALDHPAESPQLVLRLDAAAGDAWDDPAPAEGLSKVLVVVSLVGVEFLGSAPWTADAARPDRLERIDGGDEHLGVVDVGGAHQHEALIMNESSDVF